MVKSWASKQLADTLHWTQLFSADSFCFPLHWDLGLNCHCRFIIFLYRFQYNGLIFILELVIILLIFTIQGLDVLEIMRHIQVFVTQYAYNLNNQVCMDTSLNFIHWLCFNRSLLSVPRTTSIWTRSTSAILPTLSGPMALASWTRQWAGCVCLVLLTNIWKKGGVTVTTHNF